MSSLTAQSKRVREGMKSGRAGPSPVKQGTTARRAGCLAAAAALALPVVHAGAAIIPAFSSGGGSGGHLPGAPFGATYGAPLTMTSGTPGLDPNFNPHVITFPGGSTTAKAGLGRTQSTSSARILFAAGTGVGQTDPGHVQSTSTLEYQFGATWTIPVGQTFGPPINGVFSVPIAGVVGAGGSVGFEVEVHWDVYNAVTASTISDARAAYSATRTYTTTGAFTDTFNAPARPFSPSSLSSPRNTEGVSQISMHGFMRFTANNDREPSLIEIPTAADFPEFAGQPGLFDPAFMAFAEGDIVPEPGAIGLVAAAGLLAGRRRRAPLGR